MTLHAHLLTHGAIRLADVPDADRDALQALVRQRLVMNQYGPGQPRAVLTRRGRVELSSVPASEPVRRLVPRPPELYDF